MSYYSRQRVRLVRGLQLGPGHAAATDMELGNRASVSTSDGLDVEWLVAIGDAKLDVIFIVGMEGRVEDADEFSILQEPDVSDLDLDSIGAIDVGASQRIPKGRSERVLG